MNRCLPLPITVLMVLVPAALAQSQVTAPQSGPLPAAATPAATAPAATGKQAAGKAKVPVPVVIAGAPEKAGVRPKGRTNDRIDLDASQITGNRELPKVLYIVPWKRPDLGDLLGKPVNSLLDEVLAPVDRDVFKRENRYFEALQPSRAAPQPVVAPATPASAASPPTKPEP